MLLSFSHPQYLLFLFTIPLFFVIHFYSLNNKKKLALRFANFEAISRIRGIDFFSKNIVVLFLDLFILLLLILSISGLTINTDMQSSSFSFVLTIDSSQSMEATDFSPSRLSVAKETAKGFVNKAPLGVSMGVVSFAGSSYIDNDLTEDKGEVIARINAIEINRYGGTDIFEAVITSTNLLKDYENKAIILLSDGQINVGTVEEIIEYANQNNVIIHTIAMGTVEGGPTVYGLSKLDEDSLKSLAYNTGGNFFLAEDQKELSDSFLEILRLTKKNVSIKLSTYLVLFAIIIFIIEFFLANTRYLSLV